jgi:hypothetical protein
MTTPQSGESFLSKIHEIAIGTNHHTDDEIEKLLALGYASSALKARASPASNREC